MEAYRRSGCASTGCCSTRSATANCRPVYRAALQKFLRGLDLDEETRARIEINPLRVLDDKRPEVRRSRPDAPMMTDYLCASCKAHHDEVRALLHRLGVAFEDDPRLVRGLDYYSGPPTSSTTRGSARSPASAAAAATTGCPRRSAARRCPAVGLALGVDRTVLAMEAEGTARPSRPPRCQVFAVPLGEEAPPMSLR